MLRVVSVNVKVPWVVNVNFIIVDKPSTDRSPLFFSLRNNFVSEVISSASSEYLENLIRYISNEIVVKL